MPDLMPAQGFDVSVNITSNSGGIDLAGEFQECEISIKEDIEEYETLNEESPMLLPGTIKISGKVKRGLLHPDIIGRVYGATKLGRGAKRTKPKVFSITTTLNSDYKGFNGRIRLNNVRFESLDLKSKAGKGVVDKDLSFKAESIEQL